jgi:hypothetical protein
MECKEMISGYIVDPSMQHIVGYIEAKDPSTENLDSIETTEQRKRYLATFPNLILTNLILIMLSASFSSAA